MSYNISKYYKGQLDRCSLLLRLAYSLEWIKKFNLTDKDIMWGNMNTMISGTLPFTSVKLKNFPCYSIKELKENYEILISKTKEIPDNPFTIDTGAQLNMHHVPIKNPTSWVLQAVLTIDDKKVNWDSVNKAIFGPLYTAIPLLIDNKWALMMLDMSKYIQDNEIYY